jgi:hypothetical protein
MVVEHFANKQEYNAVHVIQFWGGDFDPVHLAADDLALFLGMISCK